MVTGSAGGMQAIDFKAGKRIPLFCFFQGTRMLSAYLLSNCFLFPSYARSYDYLQWESGSPIFVDILKANPERISKEYDGTHYAYGKLVSYPTWLWVNEYCYYFTDQMNYLKSTTTPDGYTVDEQGRWSVNGIPQTNNYGKITVGTDELYSGKNDDELWTTMKELLEANAVENFLQEKEGRAFQLALYSEPDRVYIGQQLSYNYTSDVVAKISSAGSSAFIFHNDEEGFIYSRIRLPWADVVSSSYDAVLGPRTEKLVKTLLGDHVGQELFNDIKAASDPYITYGEYLAEHPWEAEITPVQPMTSDSPYSDGFNSDLFDNTKWQNRTTDYGKTFSVIAEDGAGAIKIIIQ